MTFKNLTEHYRMNYCSYVYSNKHATVVMVPKSDFYYFYTFYISPSNM